MAMLGGEMAEAQARCAAGVAMDGALRPARDFLDGRPLHAIFPPALPPLPRSAAPTLASALAMVVAPAPVRAPDLEDALDRALALR
ncbi:MAG TPA: hypothetical protein VFQ45_06070 [Longimicrobium sp.]|nr:hypothetical protein [Longimicrobium sp.]